MSKPALTQIERKAGVPQALSSCHTAQVGGYTVEGHVPADVVRKMLDEKPNIRGIAVAGMPPGSPGMDHGSHKVSYNVEAFDAAGGTHIYATR